MKNLSRMASLLVALTVSASANPHPAQHVMCEPISVSPQYLQYSRLPAGSNYATSLSRAGFVHAPLPDYPYAARSQRLTGSGIVRLYVNEKGTVTSVKLLKSTGHPSLDEEALLALRRWWGARPGPLREVDVPVTFISRG